MALADTNAFPKGCTSVCLILMATFFQERQKQLESLGISLQSSGIKVGDNKCFLVNLNADPALNELLVYYLKVKINKYIYIYFLIELRANAVGRGTLRKFYQSCTSEAFSNIHCYIKNEYNLFFKFISS